MGNGRQSPLLPSAADSAERTACAGVPVMLRGDEHSLEDVVGHVLRNADRHRLTGPISIRLEADPAEAGAFGQRGQSP